MWDPALIDLFRSEVETHSETLSSALLELERTPGDTSRIDEMMRAAHSIKGASRVVGIDPAVRVAHVMEDCFVAAQKGILKLSSADVDVLLRGVDLLSNIGDATSKPNAKISETFDADVQVFVTQLEEVLKGNTKDTIRPNPPVPAAAANPTSATPKCVTLEFPIMLDAEAAERLRQQLVSAVEAHCETIGFNLAKTEDLDLQGLSFLAAVPGYLALHDPIQLQLSAVSSSLQTVLRVTGLDRSYCPEEQSSPGAR